MVAYYQLFSWTLSRTRWAAIGSSFLGKDMSIIQCHREPKQMDTESQLKELWKGQPSKKVPMTKPVDH